MGSPRGGTLIALTGKGIDGAFVRSTLRSILPGDDPRHQEIDGLLRAAGAQ